MNGQRYDIGVVGLGVMGRNLALNIADHGFAVAAYNRDPSKVQALREEAGKRDVLGVENIEKLTGVLREPRAVMLMVTAGAAVDAVIEELLPHLKSGDTIIDGGNSHFRDTDRRCKSLTEWGIHFLGCGVSGGESGARHGPSMMPGGSKEAYERVRPIFEAVSAKVSNESCVAFLGSGAAGHYTKMVHNGIEYGLMQLIAETYDLMHRGLGMKNDEMQRVFEQWNKAELASYLMEITASILLRADEKTGDWLLNLIQDVARQKGTGIWTSQNALELQCPVPTIDAAVTMRNLSMLKKEREAASRPLKWSHNFRGDKDAFIAQLRNALYAATIITYAQGLTLLQTASQSYKYGVRMEEVARIWRGGCIIRAAVLDKIRAAYRKLPLPVSPLTDDQLSTDILARQGHLRTVVAKAAQFGIPAPALMASLAYFDAYRSARLPTNLIQAQRDYFGAHTYERTDQKGTFHTKWE